MYKALTVTDSVLTKVTVLVSSYSRSEDWYSEGKGGMVYYAEAEFLKFKIPQSHICQPGNKGPARLGYLFPVLTVLVHSLSSVRAQLSLIGRRDTCSLEKRTLHHCHQHGTIKAFEPLSRKHCFERVCEQFTTLSQACVKNVTQ